MAIAVNGGHISRALDFYNAEGKYFIIGGTKPWTDESGEATEINPAPKVEDYRLTDVIGLKKVDNTYMVVPTTETENVISYRNQNWKKVDAYIELVVGPNSISEGSFSIPVTNMHGGIDKQGAKVRIANIYEGTVVSTSITGSGYEITLDTPAPVDIPAGSAVIGGAMVEGAKYVYVDCYLNYDEFPIYDNDNNPLSYRQIGLCTGVLPNTENILRSAGFSPSNSDEFTSLGVLEILDNRKPNTRDINQRELLSLIVEF